LIYQYHPPTFTPPALLFIPHREIQFYQLCQPLRCQPFQLRRPGPERTIYQRKTD